MNHSNNLTFLLIIFALLIFRRIRSIMGFQRYSSTSLMIRMVLFLVFGFITLCLAVLNPITFLTDSIGIVIGLGLLYFGVKHTLFEKRENGLYYRTHAWVEFSIIFLFVARYLYRFYMIKEMGAAGNYQNQQDLNPGLKNLAGDPLTGFVLFIIYTYYVGYFIYIYEKGKKVLAVRVIEKENL